MDSKAKAPAKPTRSEIRRLCREYICLRRMTFNPTGEQCAFDLALSAQRLRDERMAEIVRLVGQDAVNEYEEALNEVERIEREIARLEGEIEEHKRMLASCFLATCAMCTVLFLLIAFKF